MYSSEALKKKQEKEKKKNEFYLKYGHRPIEYNFELPIRYSPPPTYSAASWLDSIDFHVSRDSTFQGQLQL